MKITNNLLKKYVKERSGKMLVAPSILSVPHNKLNDTLIYLEKLEVPYLHLDVMDGIFVPNKTYDASHVKEIRNTTNLILDTHLMISQPELYIDDYIRAGSDIITFHLEATSDALSLIRKIKKHNIKCGISIKPDTMVEEIVPYLKDIDVILIMSVEPGFGGQKFMPKSLEKISYLSNLKKKYNYNYIIEVDGGINEETAKLTKKVGCDVIVVGTYLMNSLNIKETYEELKKI